MSFPSSLLFTTLGSDTFQRADENPLSQGGKWANLFLPLKIVSDQCVAASTAGNCEELYVGASLPANQWAEFTVGTISASNAAILGLRAQVGIQNGYAFFINTNGALSISNGTGTTLAAGSTSAMSPGDVFRAVAIGSALSLYKNSTLVLSASDSSFSSLGLAGLGLTTAASTTIAFSAFQCGSVLVAPVSGFSPNIYEGQRNAGLSVYISPGNFGGLQVNGQLVTVPANSTSYLYLLTGSGVVQVGPSLPNNAYAIAIVVSGQIVTSGINQPGRGNYTTNDGILSIADIRT
jgi:hypothetical protein